MSDEQRTIMSQYMDPKDRQDRLWYAEEIVRIGHAVYGATNNKTIKGLMKAIEVDPVRVNKLIGLLALAVLGSQWRHLYESEDDEHEDRQIRDDQDAQWLQDLRTRLDEAFGTAISELRAAHERDVVDP